ncbi:MAG: hypothetical protein IPF82_16340 [Blastocatellia bacterium]|nr:hypothetical protein [Blastocatellia bacterium]
MSRGYGEVVLRDAVGRPGTPGILESLHRNGFVVGSGAILTTRRPRSRRSRSGSAFRRPTGERQRPQFETDGAGFLGRGRTTVSPVAVAKDRPLSNTSGRFSTRSWVCAGRCGLDRTRRLDCCLRRHSPRAAIRRWRWPEIQ